MNAKSKADLEARKLELEIQELERHWWQKPGYVAAIIPVLVAVITLGQILWTNHFKNQRTLLEIESKGLEAKKKEIGKEIEVEKKKLAEANEKLGMKEEELVQAGMQYSRELKAAQEKHAASLARYEMQYEKQLKAIERSNEEKIEQQKQEATQALAGLEEKVEEQRKNLELERNRQQQLLDDLHTASIRFRIDTLRKSNSISPAEPASNQLIELLQAGDKKLITAVEEELNKEVNDVVLKGNLLYILFRATGEVKWFDELLKLAQQNPDRHPKRFWIVFGHGNFGNREVEVWRSLLSILNTANLDVEQRSNLMLTFQSCTIAPSCQAEFLGDYDLYFDSIRLTRDMVLEASEEWLRSRALATIASLNPEAGLITLAVALARLEPSGNESQSERLRKSSTRSELFNTIFFSLTTSEIKQRAQEIEFPDHLGADWERWLKTDNGVMLLERWIEDNALTGIKAIKVGERNRRIAEQQKVAGQLQAFFDAEIARPERNVTESSIRRLLSLFELIDPDFMEPKSIIRQAETFYERNGFKVSVNTLLSSVNNVVLGKTSLLELKDLEDETEQTTTRDEAVVIVKDVIVSYDENALANGFYLTRDNPMPYRWKIVGFNWTRSYLEWLSLFENLGWSPQITKPPIQVDRSGAKEFEAVIEVFEENITITLDFNFQTGDENSPSTLYSISIYRILSTPDE